MKKKFFLVIMGLLLMLPFTSVEAATKVKVHVFYGEGCGYCHRLLNFLDTLKMDPNYNYMFEIEKYETWYSTDNKMLGEKVAEELNVRFSGVPFYVIGDRSIAGYLSTEHDEKIKANIKYAYENDIRDVVEYVRSGNTVSTTRKPTSTTSTTTTTTTRRTYNTTYKGTTTNGWGSVGDNTTTTRIPITTTEEMNYTTKPPYDSSKKPVKDKNGRLPEDIINEYFKRLKEKDESIIELYDPSKKTEEEVDFSEIFDKETNFTYEIKDYIYEYETDEQDTSEYKYDPYVWIYTLEIEGKVAGYEIGSDGSLSTISVRMINGEYYICDEDIEIAETIGNFFNMIGTLNDLFGKEFGATGFLIIPLIILIALLAIILNFLPFIIIIIIIVSVIKSAKKTKEQQQNLINNGQVPPNNNGQV